MPPLELHQLDPSNLPDDSVAQWREILRRARVAGYVAERFTGPLATALLVTDRSPLLAVTGTDLVWITRSRSHRDRFRVESDGEVTRLSAADLKLVVASAHNPAEEQDDPHETYWVSFTAAGKQLDKKNTPWQHAAALVRGDRLDILSVVVYAVVIGILSLALPLTVQVLVNTVAFGTLLQPLLVLSALLTAGLVFAASLRAIQTWLIEIIQRRLFVRLILDLSDRLPRVKRTTFERTSGPELVNRFFDVFTAQKAIASLLLDGIKAVLTVLFGLMVLALYHPLLLGLGVLILVSVSVILFVLGRGAVDSSIVESKHKYAVAGWLEDMARHPFVLKTEGASNFAKARLGELAGGWLDSRDRHFRHVFRQLVGFLALEVAANVALLSVGGWLVMKGELSIGQLVAAELIVTAVVAALSSLGAKLETAYDLAAATDKLGVLLSLEPERLDGDTPSNTESGLAIEIRSVSLHKASVKDLNMKVEAGERLHLQAPARMRHALAEMLYGLREPDSGVLAFRGHDVTQLSLATIRSWVRVVRGPETLTGTIADNLRAESPELESDAMWTALERVGLAERVRNLPGGLNFKVGPDSFVVDEGERLRLAVARALLSEAKVLIFDGTFDWLDPEAELVAALEGRTVITMGASAPSFSTRTAILPTAAQSAA